MWAPTARPASRRLLSASLVAILLFAGALSIGTAPGTADAAPLPAWTEVSPVLLVPDAAFPTDLDVAPDGAIWYTELEGNVSRYDPASNRTEHMHHVPNVVVGRERGLVGLALAHDFSDSGAYYLYYTERGEDPDGGTNHLVRIQDGRETRLASLSAWLEHNGGRIVVTPNGTLFVGTGENSKHAPAQDLDSLLGKILHLHPDGAPVAGNLKGLVHSYGHRNVFGLARDPDTGDLWAAENMGWRRDELNLVQPGGNHGYPECEGNGLHGVDDPCPRDKGYTFPVITFYEDRAAAPTCVTFWRGGLHWCSFNEGSIHHTWQDDEGTWRDEVVHEHGQPVLDLTPAPDGGLYLAALDGIWHLRMPAGTMDEPGPDAGPTDTGGAPTNTIPALQLPVLLVAAAVLMRSIRTRGP